MNDTDKTIPYRLSAAELENFRLLQKRTNPCGSTQHVKKAEKLSEEIDAGNSAPDQIDRKEKKSP